jgi:signal transduction histidine kinase
MVAVRAAAHRETIRGVVQEIRPVGLPPRWLSMNAMPLSIDGRHAGAVLSFTDISQRKRAEQELRRTEQALREANDQLREADQRKDDFIGMLSHELRNPLGPIRNSVFVLRHAFTDTEQATKALAVVERQSDHLTRLVDDLLDVTRISRGKIELRRSRVDLRELVQRAADDFRSVMEQRGLALKTEVPGVAIWADADPTRVAQIVANLLHNACKFTPRAGEVFLSLRAKGSHAQLCVRDTGPGIQADLLPRIFDAFVQGDLGLARGESGLGLGLALVRGLAQLHGGTATVHSEGAGRGAAFTVDLPSAAAPDRRDEPPQTSVPIRARRVLVVDDNRDGADSLAQLVEILGHTAEVAYDGPSALEKVCASHPEIVFCDIGLPGMSGYELAPLLRARGTAVRLFAVSGYAQPDDVRQAVQAGFDGHLAKPVDVADIKRLLR